MRHHSPELRWLSLPGSFALHHAPLLVADLRHLALHAVPEAESTVAATVARLPYLTSLRLSVHDTTRHAHDTHTTRTRHAHDTTRTRTRTRHDMTRELMVVCVWDRGWG